MRFSRTSALLAAVVAFASVTLIGSPADAAPGRNNEAAKACQNGGYVNYQTTSGARFADEGACTRYAARGGTLVPVPVVVERSVAVTFELSNVVDGFAFCEVVVSGEGFAPSTTYAGTVTFVNPNVQLPQDVTTDAAGSFSDWQYVAREDAGDVYATVDGVSSPTVPVDC